MAVAREQLLFLFDGHGQVYPLSHLMGPTQYGTSPPLLLLGEDGSTKAEQPFFVGVPYNISMANDLLIVLLLLNNIAIVNNVFVSQGLK